MNVQRPRDVNSALETLWDHARKRLETHRGGEVLFATIRGNADDDELLAELVDAGFVWTIGDNDDRLLGFAVVRNAVVEALFIDQQRRRQRVATTLLDALVASASPPMDGYALPGDRGMKSLYESFGWKARLLTMRGE